MLDKRHLKTFWQYAKNLWPSKMFIILQGHEMCALLILGEISDSSLINATNNTLQMWVVMRLWLLHLLLLLYVINFPILIKLYIKKW